MELKVEGLPNPRCTEQNVGEGEKDRDASSITQAWGHAGNTPSSEGLAAASVPSHH